MLFKRVFLFFFFFGLFLQKYYPLYLENIAEVNTYNNNQNDNKRKKKLTNNEGLSSMQPTRLPSKL